ncbi:hypothetical protein H6776_01850 [Candidatus Nomurabacteria bacterium]|nr:hypothetical protein [Candidatus Nomurabacteria bacterium]
MNRLKFLVLIIVAIMSTPVDAKDIYMTASDANNLKIIPDEVVDSIFTLEQNYYAFYGDTVVTSSEIDYQFSGFQFQKVEDVTQFFYSHEEQKNIAQSVIKIIFPMEPAWVFIITVFAYYFFFGYLMLKIDAVAAVAAVVASAAVAAVPAAVPVAVPAAAVAAVPVVAVVAVAVVAVAAAVNEKFGKITFFITSIIVMAVVSYIYMTPVFITACVAGLAIALILNGLSSARTKAE